MAISAKSLTKREEKNTRIKGLSYKRKCTFQQQDVTRYNRTEASGMFFVIMMIQMNDMNRIIFNNYSIIQLTIISEGKVNSGK